TPGQPARDIWAVVYQAAGNYAGMNYPNGILHIYGDYGYQQSTDGGKIWSAPSFPNGTTADIKGMASLAVSPDEPWVVFVVVSDEETKAGTRGDDALYESDKAGDANQVWWDKSQIEPQGRVPFVATHPFGVANQYDVWFGDVQLFRATATSQMAPTNQNAA